MPDFARARMQNNDLRYRLMNNPTTVTFVDVDVWMYVCIDKCLFGFGKTTEHILMKLHGILAYKSK